MKLKARLMTKKTKKICLIFAGGTTIDEKDLNGTTVNKEEETWDWLKQIPELSLIAKIEPIFVATGDKELSGHRLWQKVSQTIFQKINEVDGFVVLFDVDSILYSGIALSFALKNLNKPVILTGSQITEQSIRLPDWNIKKAKAYGGLGVKSNLINAIQIATMELPAVGLMFGNHCVRAVKARRSAVNALNIFTGVDDQYLARIDFGISPSEKIKPPKEKLILNNKFEPKVINLKYYSGLDFSMIKGCLGDKEGMIIEISGGEIIPKPLLKNLEKLKIPTIIYNRLCDCRTNKDNFIEISNLTPETALVKFMWALGKTKNPRDLEILMRQEFCNEIIEQ